MITIDEALDTVLGCVQAPTSEEVPLLDALGRATAHDVVSSESVPSFDNSAMDGFAVRGTELEAGRRRFPIALELPAGTTATRPVPEGAAAKIMTGAPLPAGVDTVVPVEGTKQEGDVLVVVETVHSGANVRSAGEDVVAGDVILSRGTRLGPAEIGLLASVGHARVRVARRPRVAILATGSELVPLGDPVGPGQIRNSNSFTAYGQVLEAGAEPVPLGIAHDDLDETRRLIGAALEHDVVITSGGVSVGEWDLVKGVQEELGVERRFWRVATKPGKPLAFGTKGTTLVFGVPGNPVAAMVSFELYIRPALLALQGRRDVYRPYLTAAAMEEVERTRERTEARRCRLVHSDGGWGFTTTGPQGSAILRSMALAQGLALVPPGYPGGGPGAEFTVQLLWGDSDVRPPYPS